MDELETEKAELEKKLTGKEDELSKLAEASELQQLEMSQLTANNQLLNG
jgi:hypothetical protein